MGTTIRQRRHIRTAAPDDDLLRILSEPPEHDFSIFCYTDPDLERAWRAHGEGIVRAWIRHSPGCRPAFWWMHDSPEPRRPLSGEIEPDAWSYAFGLPTTDFDDDDEFETQHQYLKRLKLLLPREGAPIREPHPTAPAAHEFWMAYRCRTG